MSKVKLWIYFDAGTLRWTDCFVTNNDYELLNVDDTNIDLILEENVDTEILEEVAKDSEDKGDSSDWY